MYKPKNEYLFWTNYISQNCKICKNNVNIFTKTSNVQSNVQSNISPKNCEIFFKKDISNMTCHNFHLI